LGRLDGKVAVIIGGTAGIGEASSKLFVKEGAKVMVAGRNSNRGEALEKELKKNGDAIYHQADASKADQVRSLIQDCTARYGGLDVLFNNAGVEGNIQTLVDTPEEAWDEIIAVNLKSVYLACHYAIPEMIKNKGGSIINTSSIYGGVVSGTHYSAYCASKGGIVGLTKELAVEVAQNNIRVNCITPGWIQTPMNQRELAFWGPYTKQSPEQILETFHKLQPIGRMGTADEIAYMALFLASDESSFATGSCFVVDGGYTAQ